MQTLDNAPRTNIKIVVIYFDDCLGLEDTTFELIFKCRTVDVTAVNRVLHHCSQSISQRRTVSDYNVDVASVADQPCCIIFIDVSLSTINPLLLLAEYGMNYLLFFFCVQFVYHWKDRLSSAPRGQCKIGPSDIGQLI